MTKENTCINSKQESFNTFREHYFTTIKHLLAVDQKYWTLTHNYVMTMSRKSSA